MTGPQRLHAFLAHAGVASRRAAERIILEGRVSVNGQVANRLGLQIDPSCDSVAVDGRPVEVEAQEHRYLMLHKPAGVVSTANDPEGRQTVVQLVPDGQRLYPVGRLDADSEGLMLLTNDGQLAFCLTQARFAVDKEYHARVRCQAQPSDLARLRSGVELDDGPARAVAAGILERDGEGCWVRVVLHGGRKRQVRRMLAAIGCPVQSLRRVRIGPLELGSLPPGRHRALTGEELAALRSAVGLVSRSAGAYPPPAPGAPTATARRGAAARAGRGRE